VRIRYKRSFRCLLFSQRTLLTKPRMDITIQSQCEDHGCGTEEESSANVSCSAETRIVFLVTTPMGKSFESIVRALGVTPPLGVPIDWTTCDDKALPRITSRVRFATHYALCLIDRKTWLDSSLTLLDKFKTAKFWDHPGDSTGFASSGSGQGGLAQYENECRHWQTKSIMHIDSAQEIGETTASDEEISRRKPTWSSG